MLMECGHEDNAVWNSKDGDIPCCVICMGKGTAWFTPKQDQPDLAGRQAECSSCSRKQPSSGNLAFFEYRGPGSSKAERVCRVCRYYDEAHAKKDSPPKSPWVGHDFVASDPYTTDSYYCGCRGWD